MEEAWLRAVNRAAENIVQDLPFRINGQAVATGTPVNGEEPNHPAPEEGGAFQVSPAVTDEEGAFQIAP